MQDVTPCAASSEEQFADFVDRLANDPDGRRQLTELLREDHCCYDQRGTSATVRMRGWVLLALARVGLSDDALLFALEELDTSVDAYLVATAARALRSYPRPSAAFVPFVMRAITNVRYHDEPVSLEAYGEYADADTGTSPVHELLRTLAWLGRHARGALPEVEALRDANSGLSRKRWRDVDRALEAIRAATEDEEADDESCCVLPAGLNHVFFWARGARRNVEPIETTVFQDQTGAEATFREFFTGRTSIVVFFYTRCDNPLKCSLTVSKLGRIQRLLESRGLADQIRTAAITYDPEFDLPPRLVRYAQSRNVRLDADHRMLRATDGFAALRRHFQLGVNFSGPLVNRHRVEVYILDAQGRIAASFARIRWSEQEVVERAIAVRQESLERRKSRQPARPASPPSAGGVASPLLGTLAACGVAFFPKCPFCWAAYLSLFGIVGLEQIRSWPWLYAALVAAVFVNLASVWLRGYSTGRWYGFFLVAAGALAILAAKLLAAGEYVALAGVGLTFAGSLVSALGAKHRRLVARAFAPLAFHK